MLPAKGSGDVALLAGRFRLVKPRGQGGIARVLHAVDELTGHDVALKVLHPNLRTNDEVVARFRREVQIVQRLRHPSVVPIHGIFEDGASLFLCMPLCEEDLHQHLGTGGTLPLDVWMALATDMCEALEAAHTAGIVHRDVKPQNILRLTNTQPPRFALSDFGLARTADASTLTTASTLLGTPEYMAPEVSTEGMAEPRSDQYSLAVVLYECIAGRLPFVGNTPFQILNQHLVATPPSPTACNPQFPKALATVLMRAMAKDPTERFASLAAFAQALEAAHGEGGDQRIGALSACVQVAPADHARCVACNHVYLRSLAVCTKCGKPALSRTVMKGPWSVWIGPLDLRKPQRLDTALYAKLLRALEDIVVDPEVLKPLQGSLPAVPLLLASSLDRPTADLLAAAVKSAGLEAVVLSRFQHMRRLFKGDQWFQAVLGTLMVGLSAMRWADSIGGAAALGGTFLVGGTMVWLTMPVRRRLRLRASPSVSASFLAMATALRRLKRPSDIRAVGRAIELAYVIETQQGLSCAATVSERLAPSISALVALNDAAEAYEDVLSAPQEAQTRLRDLQRLHLLALGDVLGVVGALESFAARLALSKQDGFSTHQMSEALVVVGEHSQAQSELAAWMKSTQP